MIKVGSFENIFSIEALFDGWREFMRGKLRSFEIIQFDRFRERNIFELFEELHSELYRHGGYSEFFIRDPKLRHIHKASVKDRLVHHILYRALDAEWEPRLHHHIYSSRVGKGTHAAVDAVDGMVRKVSKNYSRICWCLKCDILRFFDSINHEILSRTIQQGVSDPQVLRLLAQVVKSFESVKGSNRGVPLGNVTSQVFANIYLHPLDCFIKHTLGQKSYVRYADDFIVLSDSRREIEDLIEPISHFLRDILKLSLHPKKIILRPLHQGIDFLGFIILPYYRIIRPTTKRRMITKLSVHFAHAMDSDEDMSLFKAAWSSYRGLMSHADTYLLEQGLSDRFSINY